MRAWLLTVMAACGGTAATSAPIGNTGGSATPAPLSRDVRVLVNAVRNATIVVATARPPGSRMVVLERRVLIGGPPEAIRLTELGDPAVLDALLPLLRDRDRAWAANALLARLTMSDEKTVDIYMRDPEGWWKTFGPSAPGRWRKVLDALGHRLTWDAEAGAFRSSAS